MMRLLVLTAVLACATPSALRVPALPQGKVVVSDSSFGQGVKPFHRVMVLPPSGTARGGFELELNLFEKYFLRSGVTVISPAITGRVLESSSARSSEGSAGVNLSDAERALLMAKGTGAEALLQVGSLAPSGTGERYFCGADAAKLAECNKREYVAAPWKFLLTGPTLRFIGRLIDSASGEVVASIDVMQSVVNRFPLQTLTYTPDVIEDRPGSDSPLGTIDCNFALANPAPAGGGASKEEPPPAAPALPDELLAACRDATRIAREELINAVVAQVAKH